MDLTKSYNPNSIVLGSAKIEVTKEPVEIDKTKKGWTLKELQDLGLARGIKASFSSTQQDIKADNGTVPIKGAMDVKATVEFSLLERDIPTLAVVMAGLVNVKPVTETQKITIDETISEIGFSVPASPKKSLGVFLKQCTDKNKKPVITNVHNETKGAKINFVIDYSDKEKCFFIEVTDSDGKVGDKVTITGEMPVVTAYQLTKGSGGQAQPIAMRLTAKRKSQEGKIITRTFEFAYGFYTGDDNITFKSKNDADNVMEVPMKFEFSPHPDMVDDNELSEMSLYREIAEL